MPSIVLCPPLSYHQLETLWGRKCFWVQKISAQVKFKSKNIVGLKKFQLKKIWVLKIVNCPLRLQQKKNCALYPLVLFWQPSKVGKVPFSNSKS